MKTKPKCECSDAVEPSLSRLNQMKNHNLPSLGENTKTVGSSAYFGENATWLIAYTTQRDADCLDESNFAFIERELRSLPEFKSWQGDEEPITTERFSHWAVGWIDYLIINPEFSAGIELTEKLREKLEDYPCLDEEDWSQRESDAANRIWRECYPVKDRVEYIRKNRREFDFRGFEDLLGCVRGKYFSGYASELIR